MNTRCEGIMRRLARIATAVAVVSIILIVGSVHGQGTPPATSDGDLKKGPVRDLSTLPRARIPNVPAPLTVSESRGELTGYPLGIEEAIKLGLDNTKVIRVLAGVTATSSGSTIYDPAIAATAIEEAKARFDPNLSVNNTFSHLDTPGAGFDPLDPRRAIIGGLTTNRYDMNLALSRTNTLGGTSKLGVNVDTARHHPGSFPLNPETNSNVELSYTQPLLQGAGRPANLAPIVIARLNADRSFFQMKDSVQQSVHGVIQAYWGLVFARTDLWTRRRQVDQGEEALRRADARLKAGMADLAEVSQARTALANFKASAIGSESNLLNQEAALANILGLDPTVHFVPVTQPTPQRLTINWDEIIKLAEQRRPDLIELKLIIEADQQQIVQARNQDKPKLDAVMLYRWNGLEGTMPNGQEASSRPGQFGDWTLGVNFAVPLGLRQTRAAFRRQELIVERDVANLDQGLHSATHVLALHVRNLAQFYDQYQAFHEARVAARTNLDRQLENYRRGRAILLNVLQAITDWGNAVSSESQSLTQYNIELASLEQETGTILETHGVRFFEERYASLGPLGQLGHCRDFPHAVPPKGTEAAPPTSVRPAENFFELEDPLKIKPEPSVPEIERFRIEPRPQRAK